MALALSAGPARADSGTLWAKTRHPETERRRELVLEAENLERRARLHRARGRADNLLVDSELSRAAILLYEAGAATSSDHALRFRLAAVYSMQRQYARALPLLESIVRADAPPPLRAAAFAELGIAYAELGRTEDEIVAYGEALRLEPRAHERARLLSNRAEAYMLLGDVTGAVTGYRAAIALLSADYMLGGTGPTTLWGLGVALDRSGDLDSGLDSIRVARIYDPEDRMINGDGWFYVPPYDRYWYEALGHWQVARKSDVLTSVRLHAYARAVSSWEEYVNTAAREDKWLPLARVRLKQCEKERSAFLKLPGVGTWTPKPAPKPRPVVPKTIGP
jgi:tetratricopeptide (TPR) repeat protein